MLRYMLALLICAVPLAAEDLKFEPIQISPSDGNNNPSSLLVTWDKPATAPKKIEVYLFHTVWPIAPTIDEFCPKWRELLFVEEFDAEGFRKAGGPQTSRFRLDVNEAQVPLGIIEHREEYGIRNVHVLFIDAEGKRSLPANIKTSIEDAGFTRADCYYLPSYIPYFSPLRLFDKKPSKLVWKLPALGANYEIEKVLFIGAENMINSYHVSRVKDGFSGWLAGNDEYSKPMVQELAKDATSCWIKTMNFKYCTVVAVTKCGLRIGCAFETIDFKTELQATEEDQKTLPAIDLKPAEKGKPD